MAGKLGKLPPQPSPRDFKLTAIAEAEGITIPPAPSRFGHDRAFRDWEMLGNGPDDTVEKDYQGSGDCVFAGGAHETMLSNKLARHKVVFTGKEVVGDYSAVTGYVIGDDSTDQGTLVRDGMSYRRHTGLADVNGDRHEIGAYVSIDAKNWDLMMSAVYTFSAVGIGFEMPLYGMDQFDAGEPWDVVVDGDARIIGGHYVPVVGRSSKNVAMVVSWARRQPMTRDFYEEFNDEAWAIVFPEELRAGKNERGFDLSALEAMIAAL